MAVQLTLLNDPDRVINVASVKHRSPFRYPGGKTWLVPRIFAWIGARHRPHSFIEPFAGGGIVGLTVAFENLADHVTLVELDNQVAAVWKTIITQGEGEWLAERIERFDLTIKNVNQILERKDLETREKAFQTLLQNRTAHGGILAPGAGLLKYGENGKGIASRWYPQTLAKRIREINSIRDRLSFIHGDAFEVISENDSPDTTFFIDPPYTAGSKRAGSRLYTHFEVNHERLFSILEKTTADFLLTYDNDDYVKKLATKHGLEFVEIAMQNTHLTKMTELLINRNLDWAI
ncbi:MAG: DNA adenine methylase [Anaerolineaceae bacterium]|nr:DNA adenine methylase [Anaerolineaceae bacterium]